VTSQVTPVADDSINESESISTEVQAAAPTTPEPATKPAAVSLATGLILDASALNYTPMLDVRVRTKQGKELYGPGHVAMGSDWLHWAPNLDAAEKMAEIIGESPLILKPESLGEVTELVVSDNDAITLFTSNTLGGDFLAAGKVIIVVAGS